MSKDDPGLTHSQRVARDLLAIMNDPSTDARIADAGAASNVWVDEVIGEHAARRSPLPVTVDDHPRVYFGDLGGLFEYARARAIDHIRRPDGFDILFKGGRPARSTIQVMWLEDAKLVRFNMNGAIEVPADQASNLLAEIEVVNASHGFALWLATPHLRAEVRVFLNHDGSMSSRVFESVVAVLKKAMALDLPRLARAVGIES